MTDAADSGSSEPALRRRARREPVAPEEALDEATVISTRRAEPVDEATVISTRRTQPAVETTRLSGRRRPIEHEPVADERIDDEQIDDETRLSARGGRPFDDATALSVRRGGPGGASAVGPRRSPALGADGVAESATTSPAEPEVVEDTILRPLRPADPSPEAAEPAFDGAQPQRAAYVPTADDFADRRGPRAPEVAVAHRSQTPPPRSLDRGQAGSASAPPRVRRLRPRARLLILAVAVGVVAILSAVALAVLLG